MDPGPDSPLVFVRENCRRGVEAPATHLHLDIGVGVEVVAPSGVSLLPHGAGHHQVTVVVLESGEVYGTRPSGATSLGGQGQHAVSYTHLTLPKKA